MAEKYPGWSPYHYVENNPIKYIDINGDSTSLPNQLMNQLIDIVLSDEAKLYSEIGISTGNSLTLNGEVRVGMKLGDPNIAEMKASVLEFGFGFFGEKGVGFSAEGLSLGTKNGFGGYGDASANFTVADHFLGINEENGFYWDATPFKSDVSVSAINYRYSLVNKGSKLAGNLGPVSVSAGFSFGKWVQEVGSSVKKYVDKKLSPLLNNMGIPYTLK